jgi:uncharacterized membrane protein YjgN (DUF898 family)
MNGISNMSNPAQPDTNSKLKFEFRGDGSEYFKIWIVNVLLTIVTLGIYSAWATVRNKRYFYSNLYLDNNNFRYLAEPLTILKGRVIAVLAFILFTYITQNYPIAGLVFSILLLLVIPYLINKSIAFNHRMSAYNNIQFRFKGSYGEAFMVMYVWPLIGILTLGILYPLALLKLNQFVVRNSSYGTTKFEFNATFKEYGKVFLIILGVGVMFGLPAWGLSTFFPDLAFVSVIVAVALYIGLFLFFMVEMTNLFYRCLALSDHRFEASMTILALGKVILINAALTVITLGLYLPAAKVRMTKYMCACLVMHSNGSLDDFAAAEQENISALGEQFGEVFEFGL